jgi:hypothetical protein
MGEKTRYILSSPLTELIVVREDRKTRRATRTITRIRDVTCSIKRAKAAKPPMA